MLRRRWRPPDKRRPLLTKNRIIVIFITLLTTVTLFKVATSEIKLREISRSFKLRHFACANDPNTCMAVLLSDVSGFYLAFMCWSAQGRLL
jgi:hypothetical protein